MWPLNVGQVYTTLQRLERDGLVESDETGEDGPQKGFRITEAGAAELAGWLRTPPDLCLAAARRAGHQGAGRRSGCPASTCTRSSRSTAATWSS